MTLPRTSLREDQAAALDALEPEPKKRGRGRPPKVVIPPIVPSPVDPVWVELRARVQAPVDADAAAGAALRARLDWIPPRALAARQRAEALQPSCDRVLEEVQRYEQPRAHGRISALVEWERKLQGIDVRELRKHTALVRGVFTAATARGTSALQMLTALPGRIAALTVQDVHACPPPPPRCPCLVGRIIQDLENAESMVAQVPASVAAIQYHLSAINMKLPAHATLEVDAGRPAQPNVGITITTSSPGADDEGVADA